MYRCVCAVSVSSVMDVLTMFEDTDEQGLVGLAVPPIHGDLCVEGLRDPDVQLTERHQPNRQIQKRRTKRRKSHDGEVRGRREGGGSTVQRTAEVEKRRRDQ